MGPPFLRGGEALFEEIFKVSLYRLQWGRPFYGADRCSTLASCLRLQAMNFNGAALFTGRRGSPGVQERPAPL